MKWQKKMCWLVKKWAIISDQIERTECEMAIFVRKKNVEQKEPSEARALLLSCHQSQNEKGTLPHVLDLSTSSHSAGVFDTLLLINV